jgi:hypothetical protein
VRHFETDAVPRISRLLAETAKLTERSGKRGHRPTDPN